MPNAPAGSRHYRFAKRLIDICGAVAVCLILSPIVLIVAIAVKVALGSPVIYRQMRPGRNGSPFMLYKFRTMRDLCDRTGSARPDAERLTPFGRFLRSTSLDELPELLNVLRGDMSLVGPRPLLMEYLPRYTPEQSRRHAVRPGITGWAQVHGRNAVSWPERFALDVWYVDNYCLALDIKILIRTVRSVILRRGISEPGEATMSPFRG